MLRKILSFEKWLLKRILGEFEKFFNRLQYTDHYVVKTSRFKSSNCSEIWYTIDDKLVAKEITTWYYGNFCGSNTKFYIKGE